MPYLQNVDYEVVYGWRCPHDGHHYPMIRRPLVNPHRIGGGTNKPFFFTNECCARYFTKDGEDVTPIVLRRS
jgi:hypothetical protein